MTEWDKHVETLGRVLADAGSIPAASTNIDARLLTQSGIFHLRLLAHIAEWGSKIEQRKIRT